MAEAAKWYVVHTYSGYENTVKATIEKTVESRQLQDQILGVSIPLETVTEITESGASKTYDRKVFPGYVLVKMVYSDDTWHVIRNIRGVTGFVGGENEPVPLTNEEIIKLGIEDIQVDTGQHCIPDGVLLIQESRIGSRLHLIPASPFIHDQIHLVLRVITIHDLQMLDDHLVHL